MIRRFLWHAVAAAAVAALPAAAFALPGSSTAIGAAALTTSSVTTATTMTARSQDGFQVTRPGILAGEPAIVRAEIPDSLALHEAIADEMEARWEHERDLIAAARARAAARRAAERRAARARAAEERREESLARVHYRAVRYRARTVAAPARVAAGGSWQSVAAALAGGSAGCLNSIIERESGGRVNATNPVSGAYGIPQALPGGKMASAGADWQTNPVTQVRWMIHYVDATYGSPCAAWSHWQAAGTY